MATMQKTKIAIAGCIIADESGGVMVLHRKTAAYNHWEIPGGKIEPGETAEQAAIRELKEEMNIDVRITRTLGSRVFEQTEHDVDATWFLAEIVAGEPRLQELQQYDKWGYFSLVSLTQRYDELSSGAKSFLEAMAYGEIDLDL
jgi:8-oxo-dGTP diphosphatase